jgi:hypothetical protein
MTERLAVISFPSSLLAVPRVSVLAAASEKALLSRSQVEIKIP